MYRAFALIMMTICSLAAAAVSDGVRVVTRVSVDSVTVGERFTVVHEIGNPESIEMLPPPEFDPGTCRLVSENWKEKTADFRISKTAALEFMTTDLDTAFVPPLKPQWQAPRSYWVWYLAAALIVAAALAAYLLRRYRKREVPEKPVPQLPADFVALRRLDEIERMNFLDDGEFKRYYTLVVDTLREYMENRYGVMAMDRTTDEILWDLGRMRVAIEGLEGALREADLVKFAKYRPNTEAAKKLMETARAIIARTALRPLASGAKT
ncbi:MAG: hypothetical protein P8181_14170 [bacterium]